LPEPDSPTTASVSPGRTSRSMPLTALTAPSGVEKETFRPRTARIGSMVFFVSSILICIPLAFYYSNANPFLTEIGLKDPTGKMTIGQMSEVFFLLLLPVFFARFGFKKTILVGMLAWALRYLLFAYGNAGELSFMLITGIALHGICYDFFFVSGQIYTDNKAGVKYKSAAQGMITLATYGVGQLIGFWVAGLIGKRYEHLRTTDVAAFWQQTWIVPAGIALVVMAIFLVLFKEERVKRVKDLI